MNEISTDPYYKKIENLSAEVKNKLFRKGLVVPKKNNDSSISVGRYTIKRDENSRFFIIDNQQEILVKNINLAHTAVVLANDLALGKGINQKLLDKDQIYGGTLFEEEMYRQRILQTKDPELRETMVIKQENNKEKQDMYRYEIEQSYQNLMRIA